jgi:pyruvate kinase
MNVARLNLSHGTHAEHGQYYDWVRNASDEAGMAVGVLADLQGPKIRLGCFTDGAASWVAGEKVTIMTELAMGTSARVSTSYHGLAGDVTPGDRLLVDDGNIVLKVESIEDHDVACRIVEGGPVADHKGISVPGVDTRLELLSEKDYADLRFAAALGVDMVALSFVRTAHDADAVRGVLAEVKRTDIGLFAKIETAQAVANLDGIMSAFDGIMIARGDLGVETPLEVVPLVQKRAIRLARQSGKPVIVATQMLASMDSHSRPTRAEASDVANAVVDGADALMLSGETSTGAYPVASVQTMANIIRATEASPLDRPPALDVATESRSTAIARAATQLALGIGASAIAAFTHSGGTARRLARYRAPLPLLAFSPDPLVRRQLSVSWGIETFVVPTVASTDEMIHQVDDALRTHTRIIPGDTVVVVTGTVSGRSGSTDTIRIHRIGS